ncbi:hypothetical protein AB833_14835 [Chromatiales bacterium (ex Bugula neritina AB1)]|nr:hypothetical protein AB833_14835 [Chromatiales bacterium (ex Bugula neritina AB1)]
MSDSNHHAHSHPQMTIDLPELSQSDLIDITRVLQAFTDALLAHHKHLLIRQAQLDRQIKLFESFSEEDDPIF